MQYSAHPIEILANLKANKDNNSRPIGPKKEDANSKESLNEEQIKILKSNWITTIEEFLAIISQEEGREGIKALLNDQLIDFASIRESIRNIIDKNLFEELTKEKHGGALGALFNQFLDGEPESNEHG